MENNRKDIDQFYDEYQVFSRKTAIAPAQEQFTLLAPNSEIALIMAQENFMRREPVYDIWVVKRSDIHALDEEQREKLVNRLDNKAYRETKGYGYLRKKWREKEQDMFDEKEILSWAGGKK
ncbi:1,2-phenylacetyl-CoA epoxidase subunit PaaB [Desertibacillus haloalkaliphilus]|uniref:1,2-phenylacetyl-CoA epoxidase subunit PaaB n=1 Tax=Desertibacillus haloalkaliphilus TaxID=1328930 RepID=UPI001C27F712|nr:1,2-phenylacetyl-CoA epoxidase subunit PaaB [Desertibacillus haloalkaliphilus]MBU8906444.1 1,2-phenylacetyl-CoA epoxidase subunit B [Desertibacillus haloalkaliphilus]